MFKQRFIIALICSTSFHVTRHEQVNVALNRPAYQSSEYTSPHPFYKHYYTAGQSVKGDPGQTYCEGYSCSSCSHTWHYPQEYSWWFVDLGQPMLVDFVNITARTCSNCAAGQPENYLKNFIVGLTNTRPTVDLKPYDYPVCGRYPSAPIFGTTVTMGCRNVTTPGRFVVLQRDAPDFAIVLCEAEVFPYVGAEKSTWDPVGTPEISTVSSLQAKLEEISKVSSISSMEWGMDTTLATDAIGTEITMDSTNVEAMGSTNEEMKTDTVSSAGNRSNSTIYRRRCGLRLNSYQGKILTVATPGECALNCSKSTSCDSFNLLPESTTLSCELNYHPISGIEPAMLQDSMKWQWWEQI